MCRICLNPLWLPLLIAVEMVAKQKTEGQNIASTESLRPGCLFRTFLVQEEHFLTLPDS